MAGIGVASSTGDDGPATLATLNYPIDVKGDSNGNLFVAESNGCRLRKISTSGIITSLTGTGTCASSSTTPQIASAATINNPQGIWIDSNGGIYLSEGSYIRYISDSSKAPSPQPSLQPTSLPTTSPTTLLQLSVGLIAYYPFDNSANDASGNNLHGTVHGSLKPTTDRNGMANQAYYFDGVSSYIEVLSGSWFNFYQDMSISVWIKQSSVLPTSYGTVVDKTRGTPSAWLAAWTLVRYPSSKSYTYSYADSTGAIAPYGPIPIDVNNWYHLVVAKQGQTIKYYLNGVMIQLTQASSNQPGIRGNGNLPLVIGVSNRGYTSPASGLQIFYNGSMDDLMIYNRTLLAAEVLSLYSSSLTIQPTSRPTGQPTTSPTTLLSKLSVGLIAYYPFDNSANDASGNNLHGTVHGSLKPTTDRNGMANQAYYFDGVSSYIEVLSGSWFNFYQDMSISVWIKQSSVLPTSYGTVVDKTRGTHLQLGFRPGP